VNRRGASVWAGAVSGWKKSCAQRQRRKSSAARLGSKVVVVIHFARIAAACLDTWRRESLSVVRRIYPRRSRRLAMSADVRHVALMPDAHLANEVCVGEARST
jgi:hypothetical protein